MRIFTIKGYSFIRQKVNDYLMNPSYEEWLEKTYNLKLDATLLGKDILLLSAINYYASNNTGYFADVIYDLENSHKVLEEDDAESNYRDLRVNELRFKNQIAFLDISFDKALSISQKHGVAAVCALIVTRNRWAFATGEYNELG